MHERRAIMSEELEQEIAIVRDQYSEVQDLSFPTESPLARLRERLLPRKGGRDGKNRSVQQNLPEAEVDPVPEEQALKSREGRRERQDVRREEVRDARPNLEPLREKQVLSVMVREVERAVYARDQGARATARIQTRRRTQTRLSRECAARGGRCA